MRSAFLLLVPLLVACAGPNQGVQVSQEAQAKLKIGTSTTTEVQTTIGTPAARNVAVNGEETWTYLYNKNEFNPATLVPYVGFVVLTMSRTEIDSQTLTLTFRNQVLASCKLVVMSGSAAPMLGANNQTQVSNVERKCG